jgi:hypothetical protein
MLSHSPDKSRNNSVRHQDWDDLHAQLQSVQRTSRSIQRKEDADSNKLSVPTPPPPLTFDEEDYKAMAGDIYRVITSSVDVRDPNVIFSVLQRLNHDADAINKLKTQYKSLYSEELILAIDTILDEVQMNFAVELLSDETETTEEIIPMLLREDDFYEDQAFKLYVFLHSIHIKPAEIFQILLPYSGYNGPFDRLNAHYENLDENTESNSIVKDLNLMLTGTDLSYALYLLTTVPKYQPDPQTQATVSDYGTQSVLKEMPGGKITGGQMVDYSITEHGGLVRPGSDGFSVGYKGGLTEESNWLQFVWREMIYTKDGEDHWYTGKVPLEADVNPYNFSAGSDNPEYRVDSNTTKTPFYEDLQSNVRTADETTLYDAPGDAAVVAYQFFDQPGVTHVKSIAHFDTFLIRGYAPVSVVKTTVEWDFTGKSIPEPKISMHEETAVKIPEPMQKKLVFSYPAFDYLH